MKMVDETMLPTIGTAMRRPDTYVTVTERDGRRYPFKVMVVVAVIDGTQARVGSERN